MKKNKNYHEYICINLFNNTDFIEIEFEIIEIIDKINSIVSINYNDRILIINVGEEIIKNAKIEKLDYLIKGSHDRMISLLKKSKINFKDDYPYVLDIFGRLHRIIKCLDKNYLLTIYYDNKILKNGILKYSQIYVPMLEFKEYFCDLKSIACLKIKNLFHFMKCCSIVYNTNEWSIYNQSEIQDLIKNEYNLELFYYDNESFTHESYTSFLTFKDTNSSIIDIFEKVLFRDLVLFDIYISLITYDDKTISNGMIYYYEDGDSTLDGIFANDIFVIAKRMKLCYSFYYCKQIQSDFNSYALDLGIIENGWYHLYHDISTQEYIAKKIDRTDYNINYNKKDLALTIYQSKNGVCYSIRDKRYFKINLGKLIEVNESGLDIHEYQSDMEFDMDYYRNDLYEDYYEDDIYEFDYYSGDEDLARLSPFIDYDSDNTYEYYNPKIGYSSNILNCDKSYSRIGLAINNNIQIYPTDVNNEFGGI